MLWHTAPPSYHSFFGKPRDTTRAPIYENYSLLEVISTLGGHTCSFLSFFRGGAYAFNSNLALLESSL